MTLAANPTTAGPILRAIAPDTRTNIAAYLEGYVEGLLIHHRRYIRSVASCHHEALATEGPTGTESQPFCEALVPAELMRVSGFKAILAPLLDATFDECARLIALDHHQAAHRNFRFTAEVSAAAYDEVGRQRELFEHSVARVDHPPSLDDMVAAVFAARRDDDLRARTVWADLQVVAHDGTHYFFEIKTPKTNKGQCLEITERILRFHLLSGKARPAVMAYLAMAYNPFGGTRADYRGYPRSYMPFDQAVVIGSEFWSIVGGATAYEELLSVYAEVGREQSKRMIDALAFGF